MDAKEIWSGVPGSKTLGRLGKAPIRPLLSVFLSGVLLLSGCAQQNEPSDSTEVSQPSAASPQSPTNLMAARTGIEALEISLTLLEQKDPGGKWFQSGFAPPPEDRVKGVLLDSASEYPGGCAIWWWDTRADLETDISRGFLLGISTPNLAYWELPLGPAALITSQLPKEPCLVNLYDATSLGDAELFWPFQEGDDIGTEFDEQYSDELSDFEVTREWAATIEIRQAGEFTGDREYCDFFACGIAPLEITYEPPAAPRWLDLVFYLDEDVVSLFPLYIEANQTSSVADVDLAGITTNGSNSIRADIFGSNSEAVGTIFFELNARLTPIEELFAAHPASFVQWTQNFDQLVDPYQLANQLVSSGICDSIIEDDRRLRCVSSPDAPEALDAYIYTSPYDIVQQSLGHRYDNTAFFSAQWAVQIFYPGRKFEDSRLMELMQPLKWSVMGQDWNSVDGCTNDCFVKRK